HDLGKALTPADVLPSHIAHEHRGLAPVRALSERLRVPAEHAQLAELTCRHHLDAHRALELKPSTVLDLLLAFTADKRGRLQHEHDAYPQADYLRATRAAAASVTSQPFVEQGLQGTQIGEAMRRARIEAISKVPKPQISS